MNGGNEQKKGSPIRLVLNLLVSMALSVGAYCLGALFVGRIPNAVIWYTTSICLLLLLILASVIASAIFKKQIDKLDAGERFAIQDKRRLRMEADADRETRRIRTACCLTVLYLVALTLLALAVSFFAGAGKAGVGTAPILTLYVLYGTVSRCFRKKEKPDFSGELPEQDFPILYRIARESAGDTDTGKGLHIFVDDSVPDQECNAGVGMADGHLCLQLGTALLNVLDEGELRQVLLHEFAHVRNRDSLMPSQYRKLMDFLMGPDDNAFSFWTALAIRFPMNYLLFEGQFYFVFVSKQLEEQADQEAADAGDLQKQASALAKIAAHDLYIWEQEPYYNTFRSETVPTDFATDRAQAYRQALVERGDVWKPILENEIPSRSASHPTFRQRWEALGFCAYSLMPCDQTSPLAAECRAAAAVADERRAEFPKDQYDQLRKENYQNHLDIIASYEEETAPLAPEALRPVIQACFVTGQPEKMEALCDQIISGTNSMFASAFARYWKGILLLHRYDKAGLSYIYQAMEANSNYIESGLDKIGAFCTMMGLQPELDEYRARAADFVQTTMDRRSGGISGKAKLTQASLPAGWRERILQYILAESGGILTHVYLVKELNGKSYTPSSFVLRFAQSADEEACVELYDKVFRLLDDWPEDWDFCLYEYDPSMEKNLVAVEGSCIYTAQT